MKRITKWMNEHFFLLSVLAFGLIYGSMFAWENMQTIASLNQNILVAEYGVGQVKAEQTKPGREDSAPEEISGSDAAALEGTDSKTNTDPSEGTDSKMDAAPFEGSDSKTDTASEGKSDIRVDATLQDETDSVKEPEGTEGILNTEGQNQELTYVTVTEDDFSNSVFIGDSRVVGLMKYGELSDYAQFFASTGLTIHKLLKSNIASVEGKRGKVTIPEAFAQEQYDRIYLCVGINEMGTGDVDYFIDAYSCVIDQIKELQPQAQIYIQSILAVTKKRSDQKDYINNEGIVARNDRLKELADDKQVFYLDLNSVFCDEDGALVSDYTSDGVHLKAQYLSLWTDYLLTHVVDNKVNT